MGTILVRYGELALKSRPVRLRFERVLMRNIEDLFIREKQECLVEREWGRIFLFASDDGKAIGILRRVFGVTSFSPAHECDSGADTVSSAVAERSRNAVRPGQSFAVRARRSGSHDYSSQELAARVGAAVLKANAEKNIRVDLSNPDVELFVEVRQKKAYIFLEKYAGPGGLPMGTQGRVVALLDDERSAAAAWMMMKRGCRVIAVAGEQGSKGTREQGMGAREQGEGENGEHGGDGAQKALEMLLPYVPELKLHEIADNSPEGLARFARRKKAEAIILGMGYEELESGIPGTGMPILFPLCGLSENDINAMIKKIKE